MNKPTPYRDAALLMLDTHRRAAHDHLLAADELNRAGQRVVEAARSHGISWDDIAHALGLPSADAARKRYARGQVL